MDDSKKPEFFYKKLKKGPEKSKNANCIGFHAVFS